MENDKYRSKLSAYKDGKLNGRLSEEVSLHLRNCVACKKELAEFERVDALVRGMPRLQVSEAFASQIIARVVVKQRTILSITNGNTRISRVIWISSRTSPRSSEGG